MQDVQARTRLVPPPDFTRTVWMFGLNRRRVRRCEWEMVLPNPGPFPQISHVAAT